MYQRAHTAHVCLLPDGPLIPLDDPDYLAWVAEGNTPLQPEPFVPVVPLSITMRQARLALMGAGLLTTVNNAVAAMTGAEGDAARIEWEFSSAVERNKPLVAGLSAALGLSTAQVDALFITATTL
jgi:hypothetical protein